MLGVYRDPRGVTSTYQWSRPETNVSSQTTWLRGKNCYGSLLRGSVVPTKFLLVLLDKLPVEDETSNALVVA